MRRGGGASSAAPTRTVEDEARIAAQQADARRQAALQAQEREARITARAAAQPAPDEPAPDEPARAVTTDDSAAPADAPSESEPETEPGMSSDTFQESS